MIQLPSALVLFVVLAAVACSSLPAEAADFNIKYLISRNRLPVASQQHAILYDLSRHRRSARAADTVSRTTVSGRTPVGTRNFIDVLLNKRFRVGCHFNAASISTKPVILVDSPRQRSKPLETRFNSSGWQTGVAEYWATATLADDGDFECVSNPPWLIHNLNSLSNRARVTVNVLPQQVSVQSLQNLLDRDERRPGVRTTLTEVLKHFAPNQTEVKLFPTKLMEMDEGHTVRIACVVSEARPAARIEWIFAGKYIVVPSDSNSTASTHPKSLIVKQIATETREVPVEESSLMADKTRLDYLEAIRNGRQPWRPVYDTVSIIEFVALGSHYNRPLTCQAVHDNLTENTYGNGGLINPTYSDTYVLDIQFKPVINGLVADTDNQTSAAVKEQHYPVPLIREGGDVNFTCRVRVNPRRPEPVEFEWKLNGVVVVNANEPFWNWTKISRAYNGANVSCRATNRLGTSPAASRRIQIGFQPTFVSTTAISLPDGGVSDDGEVAVGIGDGVSLQCQVEGNPSPHVSWYQIIAPPVVTTTTAAPSSSIDAENRIRGRTRPTANQLLSAVINQKVPAPSVKYLLDGPVLNITNITEDDYGQYDCQAVSETWPMARRTFRVVKREPPLVVAGDVDMQHSRTAPTTDTKTVPNSYAASINLPAVLECSIYSSPLPDKILWLRPNGSEIARSLPAYFSNDEKSSTSFPSSVVKSGGGGQEDTGGNRRQQRYVATTVILSRTSVRAELHIADTNAGDFGLYKCVAENEYGRSSAEVMLEQTVVISTVLIVGLCAAVFCVLLLLILILFCFSQKCFGLCCGGGGEKKKRQKGCEVNSNSKNNKSGKVQQRNTNDLYAANNNNKCQHAPNNNRNSMSDSSNTNSDRTTTTSNYLAHTAAATAAPALFAGDGNGVSSSVYSKQYGDITDGRGNNITTATAGGGGGLRTSTSTSVNSNVSSMSRRRRDIIAPIDKGHQNPRASRRIALVSSNNSNNNGGMHLSSSKQNLDAAALTYSTLVGREKNGHHNNGSKLSALVGRRPNSSSAESQNSGSNQSSFPSDETKVTINAAVDEMPPPPLAAASTTFAANNVMLPYQEYLLCDQQQQQQHAARSNYATLVRSSTNINSANGGRVVFSDASLHSQDNGLPEVSPHQQHQRQNFGGTTISQLQVMPLQSLMHNNNNNNNAFINNNNNAYAVAQQHRQQYTSSIGYDDDDDELDVDTAMPVGFPPHTTIMPRYDAANTFEPQQQQQQGALRSLIKNGSGGYYGDQQRTTAAAPSSMLYTKTTSNYEQPYMQNSYQRAPPVVLHANNNNNNNNNAVHASSPNNSFAYHHTLEGGGGGNSSSAGNGTVAAYSVYTVNIEPDKITNNDAVADQEGGAGQNFSPLPMYDHQNFSHTIAANQPQNRIVSEIINGDSSTAQSSPAMTRAQMDELHQYYREDQRRTAQLQQQQQQQLDNVKQQNGIGFIVSAEPVSVIAAASRRDDDAFRNYEPSKGFEYDDDENDDAAEIVRSSDGNAVAPLAPAPAQRNFINYAASAQQRQQQPQQYSNGAVNYHTESLGATINSNASASEQQQQNAYTNNNNNNNNFTSKFGTASTRPNSQPHIAAVGVNSSRNPTADGNYAAAENSVAACNSDTTTSLATTQLALPNGHELKLHHHQQLQSQLMRASLPSSSSSAASSSINNFHNNGNTGFTNINGTPVVVVAGQLQQQQPQQQYGMQKFLTSRASNNTPLKSHMHAHATYVYASDVGGHEIKGDLV